MMSSSVKYLIMVEEMINSDYCGDFEDADDIVPDILRISIKAKVCSAPRFNEWMSTACGRVIRINVG